MSKKYAYGDWKVDGVSCPLDSLGLTNLEEAQRFSEAYDSIIQAEPDITDSTGTVSKDQAIASVIATMRMKQRLVESDGVIIEEADEVVELCQRVLREEFDIEAEKL
ncbi:MAG: hypothetical protein J07AB43_02220 [Candidatus Nanosalina sp. J07AB43]|nr:MAG: hypothetical protein J07AB43_02220 [Candidatus Nanosalina sp. J07AB43]